jgi:hypothetical protein
MPIHWQVELLLFRFSNYGNFRKVGNFHHQYWFIWICFLKSTHRKWLLTLIPCFSWMFPDELTKTVMLLTCIGWVPILNLNTNCSDWGVHGSPQSLQANARSVPHISSRLPPSTFFPVHHSLIILSIDTIQSESMTASLNKPQWNWILYTWSLQHLCKLYSFLNCEVFLSIHALVEICYGHI